MKVFNIIDQNTNIFGKKLIEASAGTGKTFAIEHLFVRLLLEKNDLNIEEILVVTFTNAATKELKFRIRKNLSEAINILKAKNQDLEKTFLYLTDYIGQKDKISTLEDALDLFETSNIFTIHSFCFKALSEFAFEADVLIDIDEKDDVFFIKDIIVDYLKFFIDSEKYLPQQIEILVSQEKDIDNLVLKIFQNLDKNLISQDQDSLDLDSQSQSWPLLFDDFKKAIENFKKSKALDEVLEIGNFEKTSKNFKKIAKYRNENFYFQLKSLINTINKGDCLIDDFKFFIKNRLSVFEFLDEKNKKVKSLDYEIPKVLVDLKKNFYPIIKKATDANVLFYNLTSDIASFVDDFLETNEIFTFDKILQKMQKACKNENFSKKLKNRYKAAIIDEFQDTDPVQFDIFQTLFLKNEKILAFYLIGDPKQSIYSFRKADLYTYLEATKKIDEINYLDTNYRSTKPLIDSLNALLSKEYSKNWLKLPNIDSSLEYIPIKAGLDEEIDFQDDKAPIHFFISEGNKVKKWPTDEMEIKNFTFIATEILRLKKNCQKFSNKSFAVLIKDRFQAQRLKSYLQKFSINSQTPRAGSLKNSSCLNAMKEFIDACIHPNNLNKVKIALLGPFVQLKLQDLKNIDLQNFSKYLEKFHFLKDILNKKNLGDFFYHFFEVSFENFSILENIAKKKDINFYLDTTSLIELILAEKNLGLHNLLSFFKKLDLLDQDDEKLKNVKNFEDGVHILTTFMSKGLEYDIVFALGLASKSKTSQHLDLQEIDAEKMRQFYVAITRAKYRVYLPLAIDLKEKPILDGEYSAMEYFLSHILDTKDTIPKKTLLEKLDVLKDKKLLSISFIDSVMSSSFQEKEENIYLSKPRELTDFSKKFESRYIYSFSSLTSTLDITIEEKKQKSVLPKGPAVGEIFHKILENIFYKKSFQNADILNIVQDLIKESELKNFEKEVFSIIDNTLSALLLGKNSFCLKDVEFNNFQPEVEFLFSWKKDYMKGFIDLVFEHQSKYYIIDWKSNYLSSFSKDYDKKNIEEEMSLHNYYLQAAIYTKSLKRHLKILNKDFEKVFGGVFYIFLRGLTNSYDSEVNNLGIYHFFPDLKILDQMHNQKGRLDVR